MHYFYIVACADGTLYCGSSRDPQQRLKRHNAGRGSVYVRTHGGGQLVYQEPFASLGEARRREAAVKKWPRQKKVELIGA